MIKKVPSQNPPHLNKIPKVLYESNEIKLELIAKFIK